MERQQKEAKEWWSSPEEERLAITQLREAIEKYENEKKHQKIDESEEKPIDIDFQKIIAGMTRPRTLIIEDNSDTLDELERLLLEDDGKK